MSESELPLISVVIPTYRDAHCLRLTLRSLARQTIDRDLFEVIVVSDGKPDETYANVAELAPGLNLHFTSLAQRSGCAAGRNHGAGLAKGKTVVFLDSDSYASSELLAEHLSYHEKAVAPSVLAGARYDLGWPELSRILTEPEVDLRTVTAGLTDARFPGGFHPSQMSAYMETPWLFTFAHNASVPRMVLEEVGLSDEEFGPTWGFEDIDLFYRLYLALGRSSERFNYSPSAMAGHLPHFRNVGAIRHGTAVNSDFIRRKHQTFEIELGVYPPPEISEQIRYYRRVIATCEASNAGRVENFPELRRLLDGNRTLCAGFGAGSSSTMGSVSIDYSRPLTSENRHLLGIRTQFADQSFDAVVSVDLWRFMRSEDFWRFIAESFRVSSRLYLAFSFDTGLTSTDLEGISMIDEIDYLASALRPHLYLRIVPCVKGTVIELRRSDVISASTS